jgi:hypothetical protein
MIIVTGTKRSGTSMWMQLLEAAGFPPIGDAFPRNWEKTIKDANPAGFYESELRRGIYYATNPHPKHGTYLFPEQTRRHAVKVFIPGVIKTDRAFIDYVIATVRPWRQYVRSVTRLYDMEKEANKEKLTGARADIPDPVYVPPALEWWAENFSLVSDIVTRRYPVYMLAYESVLTDPAATLTDVFGWLGEGDVDSAIAKVEPSLRTQRVNENEQNEVPGVELEDDVIEAFDDLHDVVRTKRPLEQSFVERLNAVNEKLSDRVDEAMRAAFQSQYERKKALEALRRRN